MGPKKECKYNFKRSLSNYTIIPEILVIDNDKINDETELAEKIKYYKDIWKKVKDKQKDLDPNSEDPNILNDILFSLNISSKNYHDALKYTRHKEGVILIRRTLKETSVNNYNKTILKYWRSNMDI